MEAQPAISEDLLDAALTGGKLPTPPSGIIFPAWDHSDLKKAIRTISTNINLQVSELQCTAD